MNQKAKPQNSSSNSLSKAAEISTEDISKWIDNQSQLAKNEAANIALRHKEIENNARLAEKAMDYQAELLKRRPGENRKTITRIAWIAGAIIIVFLAFLVSLLYMGHEKFAEYFLQGISYVFVSVISYFVGKKNKAKSDNGSNGNDFVQDADIVKD